ncbi:hypothetical protein D3C75_988860 [compost metagenome]
MYTRPEKLLDILIPFFVAAERRIDRSKVIQQDQIRFSGKGAVQIEDILDGSSGRKSQRRHNLQTVQ